MLGVYDWLNVAAVAGVSLVFAYVAYRSLNVRSALAAPSYRKQALGVALLSTFAGLNILGSTVSGYLVYGGAAGALGNGAFGAFWVLLATLFYFVDSSVIAARRTDPQARDTLHWSKLRLLLWVMVLPVAVLVTGIDIISAGVATGAPPGWSIFILVPGILVPPVSGVIFLPLASRRAGDPAFKKHLRWFAVAALFFVLGQVLGNPSNVAQALAITYIFDLAVAFALYKSVLSLVPVRSNAAPFDSGLTDK